MMRGASFARLVARVVFPVFLRNRMKGEGFGAEVSADATIFGRLDDLVTDGALDELGKSYQRNCFILDNRSPGSNGFAT